MTIKMLTIVYVFDKFIRYLMQTLKYVIGEISDYLTNYIFLYSRTHHLIKNMR